MYLPARSILGAVWQNLYLHASLQIPMTHHNTHLVKQASVKQNNPAHVKILQVQSIIMMRDVLSGQMGN